MDSVIERLREEIRGKEEELSKAITARGGGLAISVANAGLRMSGEDKTVAFRGREKGYLIGYGSNSSAGSTGSSEKSGGKADAVPVEIKKLAHDMVHIASS